MTEGCKMGGTFGWTNVEKNFSVCKLKHKTLVIEVRLIEENIKIL